MAVVIRKVHDQERERNRRLRQLARVPVTGLYAVARDVCHGQGLPWTDPRTGREYPPPKRQG